MNLKNDNVPFYDSAVQLEKNISRLVKLVDDLNKPGRVFTRSLINSALNELTRPEIKEKDMILEVSFWRRAMGWAAMFAAACGTGLAFVLTILLEINAFFTVIVFFLMFANWMTYFGGFIL
jgi:hypothetical protein